MYGPALVEAGVAGAATGAALGMGAALVSVGRMLTMGLTVAACFKASAIAREVKIIIFA
jgi:hypothetical protein